MSSAKGLGRLPSLHLVLQRLGGLGQELEAGGAFVNREKRARKKIPSALKQNMNRQRV